MSDLQDSTRGENQRGKGRGGAVQGRGCGASSMRLGSGLAADEFKRKAGPGLKSSIVERKIEDMRVLSAYSQEVILINPSCFLD